ncbi:hypothetical protein HMPREF9406_3266 [Clostridium sp. HGF2]|nr:hypothetical protein HMPREF9406_3266 [Clostridium sp. HGF2]EQJ59065.1 hypothetical protein QSI_1693 [Clostridioides difficile P28]
MDKSDVYSCLFSFLPVHCMGRGADAASHKIVQTCFVEKKNAAAFL